MELTFIKAVSPISHPRMWKNFTLEKPVQKAVLDITGLGLYRATLNGRRVGDDYLTPGFNDYDAYLRYQTYDVTALLENENHLEVWLGDGWYKSAFGLDRKANRWGEDVLLAARLTVTYENGNVSTLETDDTWQAAPSPIVTSSIYDGEVRDDTRETSGAIPCEVVKTNYCLEAPISPAIRAVGQLKPTLLLTPKGEQVLDFGQNASGIIRFVNRAPAGTKVVIQTGEVLQGECFYRDNLRSAKSEYVYVSDGIEKTVEPLFTFFGFRYAKVEGVKVDPADFTMVVLSCDLKRTLWCETDRPLLNQLIHNTFWGQKSNFLDVPTDCPQRDERLGWTADTQVFVNTACYQADCKSFYRKFMKDMRADQTMYLHGNLPAYSPSMQGVAGNGGAVWADAGVIVPWNIYMAYGDTALLEENYPMMHDYTETLIKADRDCGNTHILFPVWTFGDWLAQDGLTPQSVLGGTENAYIQGVYYLNAIELTQKAASVLGYHEDAARYEAFAKEVRQALMDEYITPGGRLAIDTQTAYVLALRHGLYRSKEKLLQGFLRRLERDFYCITSGFTGAPLMLPTLFDAGLTDIAYRMLMTEHFPGWLYCVKLGATTIWERWNSLEADGTISGTGMNSLNHYAYGSVCEAIYSRIMGLQNAAPGWKKATIAPRLNGMIRHSAIRFDSPAGVWRVKWDINQDGSVCLLACVPEGAEAEIVLPDHPDDLRQTVSAGEWRYVWQPTRDYLHPFNEASLLLDVKENAAALSVLKEFLPELAEKLCASDREEELVQTVGSLRSRLDGRMDAFLAALHGVEAY